MVNINEKISKKISKFLLESENTISNIKIEYFFEMLLSEIEKLLTIAVSAILAGQIRSYIAVLMVILLVRRYCGGNHFKASYICFIYSAFFSLLQYCLEI